MKKGIVSLFLAGAIILTISCNNSDTKSPEPATSSQTQSDSGGRNEHSIDPGATDTIQTPRQMDSIQNK